MAAAVTTAASSRSSATRNLMKVLTTPSKIAQALDWKTQVGPAAASLATLDVHADRIGLTIAQHPAEALSASASSYYSFPLRSKGVRKIPPSSRQQLADLVHAHNVCGFVVSWPIQRATGLAGAACGRTLHTIEELLLAAPVLSSPSSPVPAVAAAASHADTAAHTTTTPTPTAATASLFTRNRPLCLWDGIHMEQPTMDKFGRSSVYTPSSSSSSSAVGVVSSRKEAAEEATPTTTTTKQQQPQNATGRRHDEYRAAQAQYHEDETILAAHVWDDFVRANWPTLYYQQQQQQQQQRQTQQSRTTNNTHTLVTSSSRRGSGKTHSNNNDTPNPHQHRHHGKTLVTM